jgi:hypothetical protein
LVNPPWVDYPTNRVIFQRIFQRHAESRSNNDPFANNVTSLSMASLDQVARGDDSAADVVEVDAAATALLRNADAVSTATLPRAAAEVFAWLVPLPATSLAATSEGVTVSTRHY